MEETKIIDIEIEKILKEAENIYGIEKSKEILRNYASYITMRQEGNIDFGNYNMLIRNTSAYNFSEQVVEVIGKLLKIKGIINSGYKYLSRENMRKSKKTEEYVEIKKMKQELIVIDERKIDSSISYLTNEIKDIIESFPEKIFIIIQETGSRSYANTETTLAELGDSVTWNMEIVKISKEEKKDFIQKFMKKSNIQIAKECKFEDKLSEEPLWKVKEELYNIVLTLKTKKINRMTNEVVKDILKKDYYDKEEKKTGCKKTGLKELEDLIGMDEVKVQVKQIVNYVKVNKKRGKMPSLHMCFRGNPGTGKTTVARIIGKIFKEIELLSDNGPFIEAQRSDLIGEYIGQTAPKTKEVIERAKGGVLFIDEAYNLSPKGSKKDYGHECIATLIKEMEDNRDNLCVILAGYTNEMNDMLKINPGFESRIQFKVDFPDYTEEEMYEIFKKMAKAESYKLSSNLKSLLLDNFRREKQKENFSNARCVRNLFEKVKFEQADRIAKNETEDIDLIKKIDIENVVEKYKEVEIIKNKIGFAC